MRYALFTGVVRILMRLSRRHRRWIALIALLGLLFQHAAMASYICPQDVQAQMTASASIPPCHDEMPEAEDRLRCEAHCHPVLSTFDPPQTVSAAPAAILPSPAVDFAEPRLVQCLTVVATPLAFDACAPPIRTRFCSLLI